MAKKLERKEEKIFYQALEKITNQREAFIKKACGDNKKLFSRVESLLKANDIKDNFLQTPLLDSRLTIDGLPNLEMPGTVIGRYKLLEQIGEGGMAVVYMAEQQDPIRRKVALKVIKLGMDSRQVIARFEAERQALAMMDHPNIAKVFDAGATETGRPYFVMELVRGVSITEYCDANKLSTKERLELFVQVCHAIQHAHKKGIIHRDIKPSNVMVTMHDDKPVPKVIDFGIAKAINQRLTEKTLFTRYAQMIGTPEYMSPEQAQMSGLDVDTRTDIYSLGVLIYQLLTGTTPLDSDRLHKAGYSEMQQIISDTDPPKPSTKLHTLGEKLSGVAAQRKANPETLRKLIKGDLDWIVMRCIEKDRSRRYETTHELATDIERHLRHEPIIASSPSFIYRLQKFCQRHQQHIAIAAITMILLAGVIISIGMYLQSIHSQKVQWAKGKALPEIIELTDQQNYREAFSLAKRAKKYIPNDPALKELWLRICKDYSITTIPTGADIFYKKYSATDEPWQYIGRSPLENITLPQGVYRWKIEKEGYDIHECVTEGSFDVRLREEHHPGEMVLIDAFIVEIPADSGTQSTGAKAPSFLIDKYEVTNEQFKAFVDQGGYTNREYWKHQFLKDGQQLSWGLAINKFVDKTGQPGPATWERGTYPEGQGQHPVSGVSWFEADAYARFVGKSLPTVHHWQQAACIGESLVIVPSSNFGMESTTPVGSYPGMGHTGLYDMAGNVREWCFNTSDDSGRLRYTLGGCWGEPTYMFTEKDARSPWDRSPQNGFRCMQSQQENESVVSEVYQPIPLYTWRDLSNLQSFSEGEFACLKAFYQYDRTPLNPVVENIQDSSPFWRKEKITFDAAYDGNRVIAHLFLPKAGKPPYQIVIYFPGVNAVYENSFKGPPYRALTEYITKSGRAMLFPIYYGTYERPSARGRTWTMSDVVETPLAYRNWTIRMVEDLSRSIDYLETRDDINSERIAYYGYSIGALLGVFTLAVEDRIDTGIFVHGGIPPIDFPRYFDIALYAQRIKSPVLMVNGAEDVLAPVKTCQIPMYELLKKANGNTEHKLYPGGHGAFGLFYDQIRGDVLDWLDRYLGPVE
jgi:serine/threonine protein kinase/formylglycine-generating enzyme required for sulfatase activity/dienelactone hydrolase